MIATSDPASVADFQAECNGQGQAAYCCVLPIVSAPEGLRWKREWH